MAICLLFVTRFLKPLCIPIFARNRLVTGTSVISHSAQTDEGCGCSQDPVTPSRDPASPARRSTCFYPSGHRGTGNIRRRISASVVLVLLVSEHTNLSVWNLDRHTHTIHLLVLNGSFRTAHLALTWSGLALSAARGAAGKLATCLLNDLFEEGTRSGLIDFAGDLIKFANNVLYLHAILSKRLT